MTNLLHIRYAPAYERFGSEISVVHFIGPNKPWHSIPYRAPGSSATEPSSSQMQHSEASDPLAADKRHQQTYNYGSLVDRWYSVYDKHYRSKPITADSGGPITKYISAWEDETNISAAVEPAVSSGGGPLGLDVLRHLALQGMSAMGFSLGDRSHGVGEYKSMPLEGRLDLMRSRSMKQDQNPSGAPAEPADSNPNEGAPEPTTPVQQVLSLPSGSSMRWTTLPTPNSEEVPPAPHIRLLSLPSTPLHEVSPPYKPFVRGNQPKSPLSLQERRIERSRPTSPPLLSWNAAIEPPPKSLPTPSTLPRDTYFPNVWDDSSNRNRDHVTSSSRSSSSMSSETDATSTEVSPVHTDPSPQTLFNPPPVPEIPQMVLQLGHYRNVTGSPAEGGAAPPTPDRTKVKRVFPWEERPRATPARVFPEDEPPLPVSIFMQSPLRSAGPPSTPLRKISRDFVAQQQIPSPLAGFPPLTAGHTWDGGPIQKFTFKLAHPPGPTRLASAFEDKSKESLEEKSEASGHDGDVEDEVDSDADEGTQTVTKSRSRTSSISTARKKYRSIGVQTDAKKMRSQAVQVMEENVTARRSSRPRTQSASMKKQWQPSSSLTLSPVVDVAAGTEPGLLSPATLRALTLRSSVASVATPAGGAAETVPAVTNGSLETNSPKKTTQMPGEVTPTVRRTEATSPRLPPSRQSFNVPLTPSLGPASPVEGQSPSSPRVSRVWDPARGVDLFKRGSEEVLARFLKISSREEPTSRI